MQLFRDTFNAQGAGPTFVLAGLPPSGFAKERPEEELAKRTAVSGGRKLTFSKLLH